MRAASIFIVLLIAACATKTETPPLDPNAPVPTLSLRRAAAFETTKRFIQAVNSLDAKAAAAHVDWERWVASDPRLKVLLAELSERAMESPPTVDELASRPLDGSTVTYAELLDPKTGGLAAARAARERFEAGMVDDFRLDRRTTEARILAWHEDSRETSATLLMPSGDTIAVYITGHSGDYRLVPRW